MGALAAANDASQSADRMLVWHDGLPRTQKRPKLGLAGGKDARGARPGGRGARGADRRRCRDLRLSRSCRRGRAVGPGVLRHPSAAPGGQRDHRPLPARRPDPSADRPDRRPIAWPRKRWLRRSATGPRRSTGSCWRCVRICWAAMNRRWRNSQATAADLTAWSEQGEGKEILYYLMARQALFLKRYDEAETFSRQALVSNPAYPRALVVLGGVGVRRAQDHSRLCRAWPSQDRWIRLTRLSPGQSSWPRRPMIAGWS